MFLFRSIADAFAGKNFIICRNSHLLLSSSSSSSSWLFGVLSFLVWVEESTRPSVPAESDDSGDGTTTTATTIIEHMVVVHGQRTNRRGDR